MYLAAGIATVMSPGLRAMGLSATAHSAAAAVAVPKGTRLNGDPSRLSVLSYNLLAPLYVRPLDQRTGAVQSFAAFEWARDADLDWHTRRQKLRAEIEGSAAD
eukprot:scaffold260385_cov31-Prasinocladus_malaysianus.AAC.1